MEFLITNELQVLCLIFKDAKHLDQFDDNYFVSTEGRDLLCSLKELNSKGVDSSINNIFSDANKRNPAITVEFLKKVANTECNEKAFHYYFNRLKKDFAKYNIENKILKETLIEVSRKGELNVEKVRNLITSMQTNLDMIESRESLLLSTSKMTTIYDNVLRDRDKGLLNYSTGDFHLDKILTTGFMPGYITTIFAATGIGKSAFALNLINSEINLGIPCIYFSLEMDLIATMDRLIALRRRIPFRDLQSSRMGVPEYVMKDFAEEKIRMDGINDFFFIEESNLSLPNIRALTKEAQKRMNTNYMVVFIDLLTMVKEFSSKYKSKADASEDAMNWLHTMVKDLMIHAVVVVQANREADKVKIRVPEEIHRLSPQIDNIKNSNAFSERSRNVVSIFREKFYMEKFFPDNERLEVMEDIMEVKVGKQTQGVANQTLKYLYVPQYFLCTPILEDEVVD